jgi:two-component system, OmpR family, sensor histidine kinase BaeS
MTALAVAGWVLALAGGLGVLGLRRRLELVACAEHELRGPLAALTLAAGRARPLEPVVLEGQLERARAALADLAAARHGRRAAATPRTHELRVVAERAAAGWSAAGGDVEVDWRAGAARVNADPSRLSQALGNLLSNALEHGSGRVTVRGVPAGRAVRLEVADGGPGLAGRRPRRGRGRGLSIAARAVEEAGGRLRTASGEQGEIVAVELPLADR